MSTSTSEPHDRAAQLRAFNEWTTANREKMELGGMVHACGMAIEFDRMMKEIATLQAAVALAERERDEASAALAAANRLRSCSYLPWQEAGGPNECEHGITAGIHCRLCDEKAAAALQEQPK